MKKVDNKGFAHVEAVIVVAVVTAISGIGWYVYQKNNDDKSKSSISSEDNSQIKPLPADLTDVVGMDKLDEIVATEAKDQKIVDLELKNEDGVLVFNLKLSNGKVLVVNAKTGAVITTKTDDETGDEKVTAGLDLKITIQQAIEIAKGKHQGDIRKVETEVEDGVVVFSVRFVDGYRVDVNATDASVTREKATGQSKKEEKSQSDKNKSSNSNKNNDQFEDDGQEDKPKSSKSGSSKNESENETENENESESESHHGGGNSGSGHDDSNDDN